MSDAPDDRTMPPPGATPPPEPPPPPGPTPPPADPWEEVRRAADEARERARDARDQARTAREKAREASRTARQVTRDALRQAWGGPRTVVGVRIGAPSTNPVTPRILLGIFFVGAGVLWTLDNFGLIDSSKVMAWWPLLICAFGVMKIIGVGARQNPAWGAFWVLLGLLMVGDNLGFMHFSVGLLWPLLLVVMGVLFLRRGTVGPIFLAGRVRRRGAEAFGGREGVHVMEGNVNAGDASDHFETFSVWSHVDRKVLSQSFRHAEVSAVMGGIRIDLRAAKPVPGGAVIELSVVWGSVELIVPSGWQVQNEATVLMGGITDSTLPGSTASGDRLILRGAVVMGGVELKSR